MKKSNPAEAIRQAMNEDRKRTGASYGELARRLDVSKGALYKFLMTDYIPTSRKIRRQLGLEQDEIFVQRIRRDRKTGRIIRRRNHD